jgi:hypothetical protein
MWDNGDASGGVLVFGMAAALCDEEEAVLAQNSDTA